MVELKTMSICHLGTLKLSSTVEQLTCSTPLRPFNSFCFFLWPTNPQTRPIWILCFLDLNVPYTILKYLMTPMLNAFGSGCSLVASSYRRKMLWNLLAVQIRWREKKTGYRGLILLVVITYIQKGSIYPLVLLCDFFPSHCFPKQACETSSNCLRRGIWFSVKFPQTEIYVRVDRWKKVKNFKGRDFISTYTHIVYTQNFLIAISLGVLKLLPKKSMKWDS